MSTGVFAAVLLAAFLHAAWNAVVKGGDDKFVSMTAMAVGHAMPGLLAILIFPTPAPESWPWIAMGVTLHFGYQWFLAAAYRLGDLSQVYPLARGSAPLLVALISTIFLNTVLSGTELLAVLLIACGIISIGLSRAGRANPAAVSAALITGVFIASYSLTDGVGARLSDSPIAYFGWTATLGGIAFGSFANFKRPGLLLRLPRVAPGAFFFGGFASFTAYAIVVWAFTQAPIALVTALRETSIVFALLIGAFALREKVDFARILSIFVTLFGAALLRVGKS